jgi:tetratricopeptide (TPR) repeat protein
LYSAERRHDEAVAAFADLCERWRAHEGDDSARTLETRLRYGNALYAAGRMDEAQRAYADVYARRVRLLGFENPDTLLAANNLAAAMGNRGETRAAAELFEATLPAREAFYGSTGNDTLQAMQALGEMRRRNGESNEAACWLEETLARKRRAASRATDVAGTLLALARTEADLGRHAAALEHFALWLSAPRSARESVAFVIEAHTQIADALRVLGAARHGLSYAEDACALAQAREYEPDRAKLDAELVRALCLDAIGAHDEALNALAAHIETCIEMRGNDDPLTARAREFAERYRAR